jgi:hypothetical protein
MNIANSNAKNSVATSDCANEPAIVVPDTLPWYYRASETTGVIVEADGSTVLDVSVTRNTTAHADFEINLAYAIHAANQLPDLKTALGAANDAKAAQEQATAQAIHERDRLRQRQAELENALRAVRRIVDGSQPKDTKGAAMVIDAILGRAGDLARMKESETELDDGPDLSKVDIPAGNRNGTAYEQLCAAWHNEPCGDTLAAIGSAMVELKQVTHQRDVLAEAIREAAVKGGIARADAGFTGPLLLMLCNDLAECAQAANASESSRGEDGATSTATKGNASEVLSADRQQDWAKWILANRPIHAVDHACSRCVPHSDMLVANFRCVFHEAEDFAGAKQNAILVDEGSAPGPQRSAEEAAREALLQAATGSDRTIADSVVVLHANKSHAGNALQQLADRLDAAYAKISHTPVVKIPELYQAAIACGHVMNDEQIVLRRATAQDGTALQQLGDRLAKAFANVRKKLA